jgi:alkanesulfonate monooxygenase SsuD/methylene tetrahydromethanopterin reductase-like flavin-dependent oxidoreductase (luciferase family)
LQKPVDSMDGLWNEQQQAALSQMTSCSFVGSRDDVKKDIQSFLDETGVDELMVASPIYDHQARLHSYELLSQAKG